MKSLRNKNKIHYGKSERCLKIVAVVVSLLFAALMLYPMIFAVSSSMKDNSQSYEVPPKLLPGSANSVSLVFDYSGQEFESEEALKDQMMQDNVLAMFGTNSVSYTHLDVYKRQVIPFPLSVIRIYRFPFSEKDRRRIK